MKLRILIIVFVICSTQMFYSQEEDGVVSLALPVRNSLMFNQYAVNPTFSFVRQQHKYLSITNKREWVQFEDAPQTYLVSYSGRFRENIGIGIGAFQQNYGVLTTFGGLLNFAYNARLDSDNNLTFGLNLGAYKSGVNSGRVVTNFPDPSLNNIPSNFLLTASPGINFGTEFFDLGLSVNNLALYNVTTSKLIEDNPQQSIQAHVMYTGYVQNNGFFDESRFTTLIKSEFRKDQTIVSGTAMLMVPKGIWAQVGYNNLYGASGGLGLNITKEISIEYNFEKALGDLTDFGPSHEVTLAYKFKNNERYDYSREDDVSALISSDKKKKPAIKKPNSTTKVATVKTTPQKSVPATTIKAEEQTVVANVVDDSEAARLKTEAETKARLDAEAKAKADAEAAEQVRLAEESRLKAEAETKARLDAEAKAKADAQAAEQARLAEEARLKAEAETKARLDAEAKAKADAEAAEQVRLVEEARLKAEAETKARLDAEAKAKADAEAAEQARLAEEARLKVEAAPKDSITESMDAMAKQTEDSEKVQNELLSRFREAIDSKNKDLIDLKEENDLSDKGQYVATPKPFKSLTEENNAIEALKTDIDAAIKERSKRIEELEELYNERIKTIAVEGDTITLNFYRTIQRLKAQQTSAIQTSTTLTATLDDINVATEFERRRRIKRAAYDNEEDRHEQDKAALNRIKQQTAVSNVPVKTEDFDFGEEQSGNIQILKNVSNADSGYYMVLAVHDDTDKRNDFITKAVASGEKNIDFFYDVNTSKYYIYYQKFETIEEAQAALKNKGSKSYNGKLSVLKIEN